MQRSEAVSAVKNAVRQAMESMQSMVQMAQDEATNAQSKPENKYDTRALEASYLAAGQGKRLLELKRLDAWATMLGVEGGETAGVGSLLQVETPHGMRWLLLAPIGGPTVMVAAVELLVISTASPLGHAVLGREEGECAQMGKQTIELLAVR